MAYTKKTKRAMVPAAMVAGVLSFASPFLLTLAAATPARAQFASSLRGQYDIFSGKNNNGPYTLSWNNVTVNKAAAVEVVMDGRTLKPEEFTVDAVKGLISFAAPVTDKSVVRVHYSYEPQTARRNAGIASSPLTLPLANLGVTQIKIIALPNNGGASKASDAPLIWNLGNSRKLMGGMFTSQLNFASAGNYGQQLAFATGNDRNGFNANYYRAGKQFAATIGKAVGMGEAAARWSLATRLTPMKWLGTSYSKTNTDDIINNIDHDLDLYAVRLGGVGNVPTLNFQRSDDTATNAQKQVTEIVTDKMDMAARLTKTTNVSAVGSQITTNAPTDAGDTTARDATVTLSSTGAAGATGAVALNSGSKESQATSEEKQNVTVRIQPAPAFSVGAEKNSAKVTTRAINGKVTGEQTSLTQKASAEIVPFGASRVTTTLSETTVNNVKVSSTAFEAFLGQGKRMEINTAVTNRSTEVTGSTALDTTRAKVALRPLKNLTFTGGMTWNPEDKDHGTVLQAMRQEFGMTARLGALEVGSGYATTTLNGIPQYDNSDPQFGDVAVNVGLRFSGSTRLDGTYKDSLRNATARSVASVPRYQRSIGLGLTHNLGLLNWALSGSMTEDRNKPDNLASDYKAEAKLGLKF